MLPLAQVILRLDEALLEFVSGISVFCTQLLCAVDLQIVSCFHDKSIRDVDKLSLGDGLSRCSYVVLTIVDNCVEALEWLVRVVGLLGVGVIRRQVCCQYLGIIPVQMVDVADGFDGRVPRKGILERLDEGVVKLH